MMRRIYCVLLAGLLLAAPATVQAGPRVETRSQAGIFANVWSQALGVLAWLDTATDGTRERPVARVAAEDGVASNSGTTSGNDSGGSVDPDG
jgi:hypothetical protein